MPNSLGSSPLTSRAVLTGTGLLLAVGLALSVAAALEPRLPGDLPVARGVQSLATPWLDTVMKAVTLLGMTYVAGASILAVAVAFALARRWSEASAFLGAAVMEGAVQVLKALIGRPRPPEELLRVMESGSSGSFPSGHVYHAVVFGGLLLALVGGRSETVVNARLEDLRDGNNAVNIHKSLPEIQIYTACGNIPRK